MNMKQAPQEVVALAKKHGYDTAEYWTSWKGYDVYSPDFTDDEIHCIGLPQVILVKNNKARMTKGEEGLNIINKIDR